jgi:hypothetical protein
MARDSANEYHRYAGKKQLQIIHRTSPPPFFISSPPLAAATNLDSRCLARRFPAIHASNPPWRRRPECTGVRRRTETRGRCRKTGWRDLPLPWRTGRRDRLLPPAGRIPVSRGALPWLRPSVPAVRTYPVYPRSRPCPTSLKRPSPTNNQSRLVEAARDARPDVAVVPLPSQFAPARSLSTTRRCRAATVNVLSLLWEFSPRDEPCQDRNCVNQDAQEKLVRD